MGAQIHSTGPSCQSCDGESTGSFGGLEEVPDPIGNQGGFQGEVTAELKLKERAEVSHREETGRRVSFILGLLILGISWVHSEPVSFTFFPPPPFLFLFYYSFIYLAAWVLSPSLSDLHCPMQDLLLRNRTLVVA